MVNLKCDPKPNDQGTLCSPCYDPPAYPYGLCITLDQETLRKLSMGELPKVGAEITFTAKAVVTSVSQYETADAEKGTERSERTVGLQITDMDMPKADSDAASRMYGS